MDVYQRRRLVALSALAAVFIIFVLLIRSCGGGDEEPVEAVSSGASVPGAATPLTQEDYIAEADAICLQTNTALSSIDTSDADRAAAEEAELLGSELDQLQSLSTPTDGVDKLDKFLSALAQQVEALDDRVLAAERGNETQAVELETTIDEREAEARSTARRFGFETCGDLSEVSEASDRGAASAGDEDATVPESTDPAEVAPPATTTPPVTTTTPVTPPVDAGTEGGVGTTPPTDAGTDTGTDAGTDTGGTDSSSGGVSP